MIKIYISLVVLYAVFGQITSKNIHYQESNESENLIKTKTTEHSVITSKPVPLTEVDISKKSENLSLKGSSAETTLSNVIATTEKSESTSLTPTTEGPESSLSEFDRQLLNVFDIIFDTSPTSTTSSPFNDGDDLDNNDDDQVVTLGRRTNFKTLLNCRCRIHGRCAKTNSC